MNSSAPITLFQFFEDIISNNKKGITEAEKKNSKISCCPGQEREILRFLRSLKILEIRSKVMSQPWNTLCTGSVPSIPNCPPIMMSIKLNNTK